MKLEEDKYYEALGQAREVIDDNEWLMYEPMTPASVLAIAILYLEAKDLDNSDK